MNIIDGDLSATDSSAFNFTSDSPMYLESTSPPVMGMNKGILDSAA